MSKALKATSPHGIFSPIEDAFLPYIEEADQYDADVNQHLPKTEHLKVTQDHRPGVEKDGFHVKKNEKHGDQVELDGKSLPGVANGGHSALVGGHFSPRGPPPSDEPGKQHHATGHDANYNHVDQ